MKDLTDFGVDVQEAEPAAADEPDDQGDDGGRDRFDRCPAINTGDRQRCRSPVSRMNAADGCCAVHGRERDPWTIHDGPETLVLLTGRLDALSLEDVDPDEVDFDLGLIRQAVNAVQEAPA